jgi:hypothetical protein
MSEDPLTPESLASVPSSPSPPQRVGPLTVSPVPIAGAGAEAGEGEAARRAMAAVASASGRKTLPRRDPSAPWTRPLHAAEGQRLGGAGLGQSHFLPSPRIPWFPGPHPARGPRSRSPDRRLRGRRRPSGAPPGRDDRGHGAGRLPPAAGVHRARVHRPELDPHPRDRARRDVQDASPTCDAHRPASAASSWLRRRLARRLFSSGWPCRRGQRPRRASSCS